MLLQYVSLIFTFVWKLIQIFVKAIESYIRPSYKSISDDIILITGGGRGIGRKLALEFAKQHPKHIILWERNEQALTDTAKEVQKLGVNCAFMVCDVSSKDQVQAMAQEVEAKFGPVSLLINNAGVVNPGNLLTAECDKIEETMRTNTYAHIWTTRAFIQPMIEQNRGHIVTISSMLGLAGLNGAIDYCTSKFAVTGFSEALRAELNDTEATGVKVTTVHPYLVNNAMFAGASTRFPLLFPAVSEAYLCEKIVHCVLTNRKVVCIPKLMYLVAFFFSVAPVSAVVAAMKFLHINKTMDNVVARQKG